MIKRGRISEYVKGGKREREEAPKSNSPSKVVDVGTSGEDKGTSKGKHQYIVIITRGAPRENIQSKETMKRKIVEILIAHNKDGGMSTKTPDRPMLGFTDYEKVEEIPNEIFQLMITTMIRHFDVFQILIDGGSSCDIMYKKLMGVQRLELVGVQRHDKPYGS